MIREPPPIHKRIDSGSELNGPTHNKMANVKYILDDLDYYSEAYQTFTRCSSKTGAIQDWVDSSFKEEVVQKLSKKCQSADPHKVLGIGSGAGNIDCAMLEQLLPTFPRISQTVVEPSEAQVDLFKKLIQEKGDTLKGVSFEWKTQTSDQYLDSTCSSESSGQPLKFHLIHAVHVLYYASDLKQTLKRLYDMLEDGGLLFIIILSRHSTIIKVHRKMNEIIPDMRPLLLTDEQIGAALDLLNMPYSGEQVIRYIQGTSIFDESSQEGNHLLDFLTHSKDFRKAAPDTLREAVLKRLRDPECSTEKDGKVDSCMLEQLVARYPRIHYTVVEPAKEPLEEFKALINDHRPKFDGVEFEWRNETFDDYRKKEEERTSSSGLGDKERFHFIHAVHSLYYADDLQQAESYLRDRLVKDGALLAILLSEEAGIYRVWDRYPKLCEGSPATNLCSAHLRDIYTKSDMPYKFYHQSWPSDISQCFDPASAKGGRMLDFITHVRNFRQSAPEELKKDVLAFLRGLNRSDKEDETSTGGYQRDWDSIVLIK